MLPPDGRAEPFEVPRVAGLEPPKDPPVLPPEKLPPDGCEELGFDLMDPPDGRVLPTPYPDDLSGVLAAPL